MNRLWRRLLATSALKFLHRYCPGFDDQPLAHLGFDLRPSWSSGPNTILFLYISFIIKDAKGVDTSYPHRKLTLFHTLPADARTAITLAAGGEWLSETLDVLFGKRDVYPSAVVLPNRSVGDAFVWYSKLFSYLYRFATVWLDTMRWQPQLGRMGMKVEGAGKKRLFPIGSPLYQALVRPIHDWAMTVLARFKMEGTSNQTQPLQYLKGKKKGFFFDLKAATDSFPVILTSCMIAGLFGIESILNFVRSLQKSYKIPNSIELIPSPLLFLHSVEACRCPFSSILQ